MAKMLVNGITIAYEDVGGGDNVLVLVHGHPFNRTMWRPQMDWIEGLNRARARFEGEGVVTSTGSERLGDDIGIEPSTHSNLEHEHDEDPKWRAIVPDLRGYGESAVVPGKTTLDIFAGDIAGLLDELGIQHERPDYAETLARLDVPALVVVGDEDAFTTRADAEQMSALLKRSELVWIKGVGHMPNLERDTEFNAALGRLLRRCADGKAT